MLIFRSEDHIDRWCAARELARGAILTPQVAWQLAHAWYARKLAADWSRHTVDETEALFARLGLTDSFWALR